TRGERSSECFRHSSNTRGATGSHTPRCSAHLRAPAEAVQTAPFVSGGDLMPSVLEQTYARIRQIESMFPIPAPSATVDVGTFDATAGTFAFDRKVKSITEQVGTTPDGRAIYKTAHVVAVDAVNVTLRFRVTSSQGDVSVDVDGQVSSASPGQNVVTADIADAPNARFTIRSGATAYESPGMLT